MNQDPPFIPFKTYDLTGGGVLDVDPQPALESTIFGAAGPLGPRSMSEAIEHCHHDTPGTYFGFVAEGSVIVQPLEGPPYLVQRGEWFAEPTMPQVLASAFPLDREGVGVLDAKAIIIKRHGFTGLRARGGPVEAAGRLRYIDGCSDSLLYCPPVVGDPCLNLLHFPGGIKQTQHTHPSARIGVVLGGEGYCVDGQGETTALVAGVVFNIPAGCVHSFNTDEGKSLDIFAYHPDSDWGPDHGDKDTHPMLSRTWVDGEPIDNQTEDHDPLDLISGYTQ